ncbi:MAG: MFS transporter [Candidatus Rokubacteria bacterium]|nr:MFS transporter [Candidatus Rokubacteria bacterium]
MKQGGGRFGWLTILCLAELGTMLVFSNFAAVLPLLQTEWLLSNTEAGLIFSAYQVGYILAVAILSTLTDWIEPRWIYLTGALWAGLTGLAFPLWAHGGRSALILRTLAGIGLAGTYMPGMRLVAERFEASRRAFAMGCYIATFTIGTSVSLLLTSWATARWGWRSAFALTALGPLVAAAIAYAILESGAALRALSPAREVGLIPVLRNRPALRLIVAYGAHTWELMGMRGWIVPFLTASRMAGGTGLALATQHAGLASSAVLAIGAISHPVAGLLSDRWGRTRLISIIMLGSGTCSLTLGWALRWPFAGLVTLALFYGLMVTAESAILSTSIAESAEPVYLGRTMALQSTVGFSAGALAPAAFGGVLDVAARLGASGEAAWGWAFTLLAAGVLIGPLVVGFTEGGRGPAGLGRKRSGV